MATSKTEAKSEPGAGEAAGPGPSKGKKMLVLILALAILLVALAGGWIFWSRYKAQQALDEGEEEVHATAHKKKDEDKEKKPPAYLTLDNMVVNLADPGGERVAQIGVTLELVDEKAAEKVRQYLPMIRNDVLLLMSQKKAEELLGREGKEQLAAEILTAASGHMASGGGKKGKDQPEPPIRRVLFSSLIIQ